MTAPSPTPRRVKTPGWFDARLIVGVLLVLGSVVAGTLVFAGADSTTRVWAASRDLAPGSVLLAGDLTSVRARLPDGDSAYVPAADAVVGQTLGRQLSRGELVPRSALQVTAAATRVTIPFEAQNSPTLARGERIAVWVSTKKCPQVALLADVTVQDVQGPSSSAFANNTGQTVVVRVSAALATRVVTALALDSAVLRAGLLDGPSVPNANDSLPSLDSCTDG